VDAPLVFNSITPAHFDAICAKAQASAGVAISGLRGSAGRDTPFGHVELMWTYDPSAELLTVQCLKHPWGFGGKIESGLRDLVESTYG
jgi:hypothetical protein